MGHEDGGHYGPCHVDEAVEGGEAGSLPVLAPLGLSPPPRAIFPSAHSAFASLPLPALAVPLSPPFLTSDPVLGTERF